MITGIGIDLVSIPRIKKALERWGDKFKKKVFTDNEIKYSESHQRQEQHFAGSFAVKEAFIKAIGERNIRLNNIEIIRNVDGRPSINLHGRAKMRVEMMGINAIHSSISHDGKYSVAVVIVEK